MNNEQNAPTVSSAQIAANPMLNDVPLPCPFCGTEAFINRMDASYTVMCPSCITVQICSIDKDIAVSRWNRRNII